MRPHRTDGISLSFGLIFLFVAVWWAIAQVVTVQLPAAGWLVAGGLIMFGAIGLIGAIRSGRRTEVTAPVQAEAQVETPGDLPPEMHADIVRELLDNPADRVDLQHPAYLRHPVSEPPAAPRPASAPPAPTSAAPAAPTSGPPATTPTVDVTAVEEEPTAAAPPAGDTTAEEEPTAATPRIAEVAGDEPTAEVTRVDHGQGQDLDGDQNDDQEGAPGRR